MVESPLKPKCISVQICYASLEETWVMDFEVSQGTSVVQALEQAGLAGRFACAIEKGFIGIYGKKVSNDRVLMPDDRIEIYRPLADLPQNIRRQRVEQLRRLKTTRH